MTYDQWKSTNPADAYMSQDELDEREIERLCAEIDNLKAEIERLRALLHRHQIAAWHEDDSDLAVETRAALEPKT